MDADEWDRRYDQAELVWSASPNQWVEQTCADLAPGRVLDLAAGEGRNALWLVSRGWRATAVDFSRVGLERTRRLAAERLGAAADRLETVVADLLDNRPEPAAYDLVLLVYLQVTAAQRTPIVAMAASAVAPGGRLLVVAHDSDNLAHGHGGPPDPAVLFTAGDVTADLAGSGLTIERTEQVVRMVPTPDGRAGRSTPSCWRAALSARIAASVGPCRSPRWSPAPPASSGRTWRRRLSARVTSCGL